MKEFSSVEDVIIYGMQDKVEYVRKKVLTRVIPMEEDFICHTPEGTVEGKAGDYLAVGVKGECYPIGKDYFAESYELVSCSSNCSSCTCEKAV